MPSVCVMPLRSYALMNPAPSSARRSIGSSVRSNAMSLVRLSRSAMTTETGSCTFGGCIIRRATKNVPVSRTMTMTAIVATRRAVMRCGSAIASPFSSSRASAAFSSPVV